MKIAALILLSLLPSGAAWADAPAVRAIPVLSAIPKSYLVFGYGTDRFGNGPFLDRNGNALSIGGVPHTIMIQGMARKAYVRVGVKPAPRKTPSR